MTASKEMVGMAKSQERTNHNACIYLKTTLGGKAGRASNPPPLAQGLDLPLIITIFSEVE